MSATTDFIIDQMEEKNKDLDFKYQEAVGNCIEKLDESIVIAEQAVQSLRELFRDDQRDEAVEIELRAETYQAELAERDRDDLYHPDNTTY